MNIVPFMENKVSGEWKKVKDLQPGDLFVYQQDGIMELRMVLSMTKRQDKNRSLWGLSWISVCQISKYGSGWFWNDSEHWVLKNT